MNYISSLLKISALLLYFFCEATLCGQEWKKEVRHCGNRVCFFLNSEKGDVFLGSLLWPKEAPRHGKEMFYDRYFYEGIALRDEVGDEMHIYGTTLEQTGEEWANSFSELPFSDFIKLKQEADPKFAEIIHNKHVRYFTDEARLQTQVEWLDGALWQVGLDNDQKTLTQIAEGIYAFVLGKNRLYIAPKGVTLKGRIQHSSFLGGSPVRSAGKVKIGADGKIVWLSNDSGHYRPGDQEIFKMLDFLHKQMPEDTFMKICVRIKPKAWEENPTNNPNYKFNPLDKAYYVPASTWLQNFNEKSAKINPSAEKILSPDTLK